MKLVEKALEVLQKKYGIDGRAFEDELYLSVWNNELSDTIDVQVSKAQVEIYANEYLDVLIYEEIKDKSFANSEERIIEAIGVIKKILTEIQNGLFDKEWILENQANRPCYNALKRKDENHPIEVVGKKLRGMMSWIEK